MWSIGFSSRTAAENRMSSIALQMLYIISNFQGGLRHESLTHAAAGSTDEKAEFGNYGASVRRVLQHRRTGLLGVELSFCLLHRLL
jgi:hypothetical protein